MESLEKSQKALRKEKMDYAGDAGPEEVSKKQLGVFIPPPIAQITGRRSKLTVYIFFKP